MSGPPDGQNITPPEAKAQVVWLAQNGRAAEARDLGRALCEAVPNDPEAWFLLGAIQGQLGDFADAEQCCRNALQYAPEQPELHYNLGIALLRQHRIPEAVAAFQEAVRINPSHAAAWHDLGNAQQLAGDHQAAIASYGKAIAINGQDPTYHYNLGRALTSTGQEDKAIAAHHRALELKPDFAEACEAIAPLLITSYQYQRAIGLLERCLEHHPNSAALHYYAGVACQEQGNAEDARDHLEKTLALDPMHWEAKASLAGIKGLEGRYEDAVADLREVLSATPESRTALISFAYLAPKCGAEDEAIARLEQTITDPRIPEQTRSKLYFALAQIYDRRRDYDRAFEEYRTANRLRGAHFEPFAHEWQVSGLIGTYTRENLRRFKSARNNSHVPVLIVGMPRSGTTLVEQIIASHPKAYGAGELAALPTAAGKLSEKFKGRAAYPECVELMDQTLADQLAEEYMAELRRHSGDAKRVTDKLPSNFLHLGLAELLLPHARIIHCMRDPMDTCLSCYQQSFSGEHAYAFDLAHLGQYYRQYQRLMEHWRSVLRIPMLDVRYEELVANPDSVSRELIRFVGLAWDPRCLDFHKTERAVATASYDQVRRPLYTSSIGRWRHYEAHLGELIDALGPAAGLEGDNHRE